MLTITPSGEEIILMYDIYSLIRSELFYPNLGHFDGKEVEEDAQY